MMTNIHKKIASLEAATIKKKEDTLKRAELALKEMIDKDLTINFTSVAKFAKISKTWLYQQSDLSEKIKSNRNKHRHIARNINLMTKIAFQKNELESLRVIISRKDTEIKRLKSQLELLYGELYKKENDD